MSQIEAKFVGSFPNYEKGPKDSAPEYAFIGRSNVGKSSLINSLTNRTNLAKTSATPGKTQMINYFRVDDAWYLVDLPGYGYAKLSKKHRASLSQMIKKYLIHRKELVNTFVLIDSRIPPQTIDLEFIDFLGKHQIPFSIVFTKADKENSEKVQSNRELFQSELLKSWEVLPPIFLTSAKKKIGQEEVLDYIQQINTELGISSN